MIEKIIDNQSIQTYSYRFLQLISENEHNIGTNFAQGADGINRMYVNVNLPNLPNNARIKKATLKLKQTASNLLGVNTKIGLFEFYGSLSEGEFSIGGEGPTIDYVSVSDEADAEYTFDITKLIRFAAIADTSEIRIETRGRFYCPP